MFQSFNFFCEEKNKQKIIIFGEKILFSSQRTNLNDLNEVRDLESQM